MTHDNTSLRYQDLKLLALSHTIPTEGELTKYLIIAFLSDRFGVRVGLLSGELVIGLVIFPDSIQPLIAERSYEKPSETK